MVGYLNNIRPYVIAVHGVQDAESLAGCIPGAEKRGLFAEDHPDYRRGSVQRIAGVGGTALERVEYFCAAVREEEYLSRVKLIKSRTERIRCLYDFHVFGALGRPPVLAVFGRVYRLVTLAVGYEVRQEALDLYARRYKCRIIISYHREMVNMYMGNYPRGNYRIIGIRCGLLLYCIYQKLGLGTSVVAAVDYYEATVGKPY